MTKAQIEQLVASAVAAAVAETTAKLSKTAPEAKTYVAGVMLEGEAISVPKGHIALIVPKHVGGKVSGKGKAYIADTRGVALHKASGAGYKFQVWAIEE